jgi:hypothetical protein
MKLPISFDQFKKNPIAAIAFLLVIVVGYLYIDNKTVYAQQLNEHKVRIEKLEKEELMMEERLEEINQKLIECLSL